MPLVLTTIAELFEGIDATSETAGGSMVELGWDDSEMTVEAHESYVRSVDCAREPWFPAFVRLRRALVDAGCPTNDTDLSFLGISMPPRLTVRRWFGTRERDVLVLAVSRQIAMISVGVAQDRHHRRLVHTMDTFTTFEGLMSRATLDLREPFGDELPPVEQALEFIAEALARRKKLFMKIESPVLVLLDGITATATLEESHAIFEGVCTELSSRHGTPIRGTHGAFRSAWWPHDGGAIGIWEAELEVASCIRLELGLWPKGTPTAVPPEGEPVWHLTARVN